jgi:hypothetical protein
LLFWLLPISACRWRCSFSSFFSVSFLSMFSMLPVFEFFSRPMVFKVEVFRVYEVRFVIWGLKLKKFGWSGCQGYIRYRLRRVEVAGSFRSFAYLKLSVAMNVMNKIPIVFINNSFNKKFFFSFFNQYFIKMLFSSWIYRQRTNLFHINCSIILLLLM